MTGTQFRTLIYAKLQELARVPHERQSQRARVVAGRCLSEQINPLLHDHGPLPLMGLMESVNFTGWDRVTE